jgi:hypothetical protein
VFSNIQKKMTFLSKQEIIDSAITNLGSNRRLLKRSFRRFMADLRVELKVCSPQQPVRLISARLSGQIRALQTLWPKAPMRFIYNGVELIEAMTFHFYGIRDGDSILALPADGREAFEGTQYWLSLTRDADGFNDTLRWMLNPKTTGELARLRDLQLAKAERRFRSFAKVYSTVLMEEGHPQGGMPLFVDYPQASEPSTLPLPVPWDMK